MEITEIKPYDVIQVREKDKWVDWYCIKEKHEVKEAEKLLQDPKYRLQRYLSNMEW